MFCTFLGWLFSAKYRKRKKFFEQLSSFYERFSLELASVRKSIPAFLEDYPATGEFKQFLFAYQTGLRTGEIIINLPFLTEEEEKLLFDFFRLLGKSDASSQQAFLKSYGVRFSALSAETAKDASRYGGLYLKIGLLFGFLVVILLV